ncbi:MAG: uroporphyrinogen-III synthase [Actinomycetota bacterium]|nr:uroporphyrinogen-III synthase [Actinomycetota bacterium]
MSATLATRTIVVTRPAEQAGELVDLLEARGALTIRAPAIEILPAPEGELDRAAADIARGRYAWVLLTSGAGVLALTQALRRQAAGAGGLAGGDVASKVDARVAAIGEGTAEALRAEGVEPDLIPRTFTTEALGRALPRGEGTVLLARADIAPPGLDEAVAAKGWEIVRVDAYRTRGVRSLPSDAREVLRAGGADALTFTSASTVDAFVRAAGRLELPRAVCIGPVTAKAAREHGLRVAGVASTHTIEGLVARLERVFAPRPRSTSVRRGARA